MPLTRFDLEQARKRQTERGRAEHMAKTVTSEELLRISYDRKEVVRQHEEMLLAVGSSFGIDKKMLKDPAIRERLEKVLGDTLGNSGSGWMAHTGHSDSFPLPPSPEPRAIPIANFRKGKRMKSPIHEKFLFQLRDALIGIVGKPGLAMTFEKVKGPQEEKNLVRVIDRMNLTGTNAIQFLERHLIHLGISLVGSTGNVYDGVDSITAQIAMASPIRLQPEILRVTAAQAVPAPELTLYCPKLRTCGYQISVQDSLAPETLAKGCPQCKEKELHYELCYADGRSTIPNGSGPGGGRSFQELAPPGEGKIIQHGDDHGWAENVLSGAIYTTGYAPPPRVVDKPAWSTQEPYQASITGKLNHDGTWIPGKVIKP